MIHEVNNWHTKRKKRWNVWAREGFVIPKPKLLRASSGRLGRRSDDHSSKMFVKSQQIQTGSFVMESRTGVEFQGHYTWLDCFLASSHFLLNIMWSLRTRRRGMVSRHPDGMELTWLPWRDALPGEALLDASLLEAGRDTCLSPQVRQC